MTGRDAATRVGTVRTSLALAVDLRDGVRGGRPLGSPTVSLAARPETFARTPGGFHVLTDLPADVGEVTVVVDGGPAYLTERQSVDFETADRTTPERVTLLPSPAYPVGRGTTVVRGFVTDGTGDPLAGATVTVRDREERTRTDDGGEFALPLPSVAGADVAADGTLLVDGGTPSLEATHPTADASTRVETAIAVGETTRRDLQL